MQIVGVTGKIYNMKSSQTKTGKAMVTFKVSVRKQFVSDQDKQDKKTNWFVPMMAMGPTAEFIEKHFNDGDAIVVNAEYQTYRTKNAPNEFDDAHIFKINSVGFTGDNNGDSGGASRSQGRDNSRSNSRPASRDTGRGARQPAKETVPPADEPDTSYNPDDDLPF